MVLVSVALALCLLFFAGALAVPELSEQDAQQRVRLCIQREIASHHLEILRENGVTHPDEETALQWERDLKWVKMLSFESIELKRPLPDIFLSPFSPTHVARVVLRQEHRVYPARYFWISWSGVDRETSEIMWSFSF
ncbi:MAG: hypothetical protein OEV64_06070 [Desulfobulbaceae bacterium]|nr:hypothetical protein [Desulfobulbaceae bacterium]